MTMRFLLLTLAVLLLAAPSGLAWKGAPANVNPISEVQEKAESGDYVVVEGRVTNVSLGSGSRYIATLEDDSGSVLVRIPEHLRRHFGEGKTPGTGGHFRVGGKWTHAYMDDSTWGIHAQKVERLAD
jgi:hypothetical protein